MRRIPTGAPIATVAAMQAAEQACFECGVTQDELMDRAGLAVARETRRLAAGRAILVLAGPGNNGGDAYVAARWLAEWGHDVTVAALGAAKQGAALRMAARWHGNTITLADAQPAPVIVDGLFGTGSVRDFDRDTVLKVRALLDAAEFVIAIDLPSGMAADADPIRDRALRADVTIALGALKPAHVVGPLASDCGHVLLADIGVAVSSLWSTGPDPAFGTPGSDAHKFSRGMVAVLAGAMPGAARLSARAALVAGAGYVVLAGREVQPGPLDAIVHREIADMPGLADLLNDTRIGAVVVGPGLGRDAWATSMVEAALASARDLILDGDALTLLGDTVGRRLKDRIAHTVLTPHSGEFDRMFGAGGGSKIVRTAAAAASTGAVIVHKGQDTVIARPCGTVTVLAGTTPWLSTAGSGDVLTGLLAARHAAGDGDRAPDNAAWLHARAAALAGPSFSADALVDHVGAALMSGTWR